MVLQIVTCNHAFYLRWHGDMNSVPFKIEQTIIEKKSGDKVPFFASFSLGLL